MSGYMLLRSKVIPSEDQSLHLDGDISDEMVKLRQVIATLSCLFPLVKLTAPCEDAVDMLSERRKLDTLIQQMRAHSAPSESCFPHL